MKAFLADGKPGLTRQAGNDTGPAAWPSREKVRPALLDAARTTSRTQVTNHMTRLLVPQRTDNQAELTQCATPINTSFHRPATTHPERDTTSRQARHPPSARHQTNE